MTQPNPLTEYLSTIDEVIEEARAGRMFILVDDEDRENEGDLIIPATSATPEAINFMATHGRGLICLAMTRPQVEQLNLPLMAQHNQSRHQTAFTVSIEAREGISTGISAPDRAHTIATAIKPEARAEDICVPGHVFPLVAREGGVLVRAGHTEAAVDIARMAGHFPAGVICEIMKDDGTMARMDDLIPFAQKHNLKIATIADLIAYRSRNDRLISCVEESSIDSQFGGEFTMKLYHDPINNLEHIALIKGDVESRTKPTLVRMHALNMEHDVLGATTGGKGSGLHKAMQIISDRGCGAIVLLHAQPKMLPPDVDDDAPKELREYGIGAQILLDLGIRDMVQLTNTPRDVVGLEGYGINIVGHEGLT